MHSQTHTQLHLHLSTHIQWHWRIKFSNKISLWYHNVIFHTVREKSHCVYSYMCVCMCVTSLCGYALISYNNCNNKSASIYVSHAINYKNYFYKMLIIYLTWALPHQEGSLNNLRVCVLCASDHCNYINKIKLIEDVCYNNYLLLFAVFCVIWVDRVMWNTNY